MNKQETTIVFLGRRWSRSAPLPEPVDRRTALDHYANHRSFPVPPGQPSANGSGVLVVDTSDYSAVMAAHSYGGDWLVIAFLPDVCARQEDYQVRLVTETLVYGGLRDLELAAVAGAGGIRCVFVVDTPGRENTESEFQEMVEALLALREEWDQEPLHPSPWPAVCRGLSVWSGTGGGDPTGEPGPPDGVWVRSLPSSSGEPLPRGAQNACREPRMLIPAVPLLFRNGPKWLAIGRPQPLSEFLVSRVYYQSARNVLGEPEPMWPEPGDPSPGPRRNYLESLTKAPSKKGRGPDAYLRLIERHSRNLRGPLPADTPAYIRRWLGFPDGGDDR